MQFFKKKYALSQNTLFTRNELMFAVASNHASALAVRDA